MSSPRGVHDMTESSVRGHIVRMMLFVLAGMAIQTLYGLVDLFWVGRLGKEAVAAVALSTNVMFVALAVTQMLSVGCVALVAQAAGRKEHAEVQRLFNQAQCLATFAGVVFLAGGLAVHRSYAERLAGDAVTTELSLSFLRLFIPALALQFTMVGLGSALRGIGDMKPGLVAQTASVLVNMALAPVFVFGWLGAPALGVVGAALATLIATALAVLGLLVYLARGGTFLRIRFVDWRPDLDVWRRMIGIGLPAGGEFLLLAITIGAVYAVTRPFGAQAQAGFGIASRVMQAGFMPAVALSFAAAAVVGQNFGSGSFGRVREARRESLRLTVVFMLLLTIVCQLAPARLVGLFSADPNVIEAGVGYLELTSWGYVGSGIVFVSGGIFQGIGNTWPSLGASALRAVVFIGAILVARTQPGFRMSTIWTIWLASLAVQLVVQQLLLHRELARKAPVDSAAPAAAPVTAA